MRRIINFFKLLGPGLMWAGAAVGVSHLVQSTRAGAEFGFALVGVLIFANIIKYPFFEFAPRYATATGKHLVHGYEKVGKWAVALYGAITILTMFAIQAAVTVVSAGLVGYIFDIPLNLFQLSLVIMAITTIIIAIGRYSLIDTIMKLIILSLAISTIISVISAINFGYHPLEVHIVNFSWSNPIHLAFLIAFVGWMPAPIDISVWHSFWSHAKQKESGKTSLKNALLDFNIGYIGTAFLAIGFLTLGAIFMYGSGEIFSSNGTVFSGQLIQLYTEAIGSWAYYVIAFAALATMFSTTLTCLDAYSRVLQPTTEILLPKLKYSSNILKWFWLVIVILGALLMIGYFAKNMTFMVDVATTISFVTAPILAFLNYKAVNSKDMPEGARVPKWLNIYAIIGILFLLAFSLGFLYWRFIY